ncbi:hypothetical protein [Prosthecobacter dejongeii]|uniref:Uncharacterized protein n=1 Tax=Prosthecobacter dejongeii TaxID=48465 RepID=A0A7W8DQ41_9BACT|nr:hypothetical protein [Prosthecobacter dejongeii]MBB5038359.1 hypothetical protein [Prosthecobacter dejongeii]
MIWIQHSLVAVALTLMTLGALQAQTAAPQVELVMHAVPETIWQAKFEGPLQDHPELKKRLQTEGIKPLFSVKGILAFDTPFVWRKGAEREFAEGWETRHQDPAVPTRLLKRFVGTTVEWQQEHATEQGKFQVILKLIHHLASPKMQRISYANAAQGAERDKHSVEYPRFDVIEWEGRLAVSQQWRLVTQVLRPAGTESDLAMRYLVFIKRL